MMRILEFLFITVVTGVPCFIINKIREGKYVVVLPEKTDYYKLGILLTKTHSMEI